ncbi:flagellar basal-body MS-ring/collar protein FliF [Carnobacterium inhibens]|uniref:Flagellar M-ring protein n=1 Tax=Carnobacterium inhibens subsp. gilichinskyi TaxID=1266845 RepID=U5SEQ0_9LACT|nr:flagellar basal-body MS-ring/collar protein FliF [Carnobacterium inhibens]AGY82347.1 flagellar M-ring protein FliF [Carnobacterium inhibens subsp. gilichinskyi]
MNGIKKIWTGIKDGWTNLGKSKRIGLGVVLVLVITIVTALTFYTQKVEYATLFSNLEEADAGTIVNDIKAKGIDYKLEDNGTTILIDQAQVDTYRIELAVNDMLPKSNTGFEIFDETSMMATDEDRKIMYQRAVTGELERSISALDSIEQAKVLLSLPEDSVFTSEENVSKASASVVLTPISGSQIPVSAVQGIASLISGAVDNLPKENIKIVDTAGNLLSTALEDEGNLNATDLVSKYQAITRSYEQELEQKLIQTLGPIYGIEKLTVAVTAEMNFDSSESEIINYGDSSVRSETVSAGGGTIDVGEGEGFENSINQIESGEEGGNSTYNRTTNYELNSETTNTVKAPGEVERLSTSVIFDGNLSPADKEALEAIVATTVGSVEERDVISIQGIDFATSTDVIETTAPEQLKSSIQDVMMRYWPYLVGGLAIVIILILLLTLLRRRSTADDELDFFDEEEPEPIVAPQRPVKPLDEERKAKEKADLKRELNKNMSEKESTVRDYAKESPEGAADLIKIWMKDE